MLSSRPFILSSNSIEEELFSMYLKVYTLQAYDTNKLSFAKRPSTVLVALLYSTIGLGKLF